MRARGGGAIVNVSSLAALNYFPSLMAYGMAKAALEHHTMSLAAQLRAGDLPGGALPLRRNRVRATARVGDALLKAWLAPSRQPAREARALRRARAAGLPVPELLGVGPDWLATRWIEARPAARADLPAILAAVERMHAAGMLHGDLHVGNLLARSGEIVLTDLQSARFLPWIPAWLRRRELGYLAFSLGEPFPPELAASRFWAWVRAHRHWRSRTRRCVMESGAFTAWRADGADGFRRRDASPDALAAALAACASEPPVKANAAAALWRSDGIVVKRFASARAARAAWRAGNGLEARGIATGRPLASAGRLLLMADAGATVADWIDASFADADPATRTLLCEALADLLAALHRRGIYHADLKANNVAWRPGEPPRLLDYARVRFARRVGARRRAKNLAQLNAALPDAVDGAWRERAFERYVRASEFAGDAPALRARVIAESLRHRHRWSGC